MNIKLFFAIAALLVTTSLPAMAAEYFVAKQGNDANDGRNRQAAFLTVQKGVDALAPGDTLTIAPGEYFESVKRDGLGSLDAQTTIQAELPGTAVLRGDVDIASSVFRKVDGYRYVYVADFDGPVQAVNEVDTLTQMPIFPTVPEMEYVSGACHYDAERKLLYISTSDLQPPAMHHYTVAITQETGLLLTNPKRVTIDGLAATGFQANKQLPYWPGYNTVWGIMASNARGCIIRNCVAYFNGAGIGVDSANKGDAENGWNLIEKCTAYANGSRRASESGNIYGFHSNNDEIRDSNSYRGTPVGIMLYGAGIRGPAVMKNNLSWGSTYTDIFLKGGQGDKYGMVENSISLGLFHVRNLKNSIIGTNNQYNPNPGKDTIFYNKAVRAVRDQEFADPENLDFRLQATSSFRGTGPDGTDRGSFPYLPNIFYVAAGGNDTSDGLSTGKAWKTLAHAMSRLRPGDTLYLDGGTYDAAGELKVVNAEGQSISIRGRGTEPVLIRGNIAVVGSRGLEFERLNFTGAITLQNSRDVSFNNCRFSTQSTPIHATSVQNLKVTHSEFTSFEQAALRWEKSTGIWLSGNIFDNRQAPAVQLDQATAVLYSDYNSYRDANLAWRVAGSGVSLANLPEPHGNYSSVRVPEYTVEQGLPRLQNANLFDAGGPRGTGLGFYSAYSQRDIAVTPPLVHSVSDTTADIEWRTSVPAKTEVAWGETPDTPNRTVVNENVDMWGVTDGFNTMSLNGLKPATKYYFRLVGAKPLREDVSQYTRGVTRQDPPLSFQTAGAATAARVLHVAPDGKDSNSGLNRQQAWRTVAHAAEEARAGDTILIAGGTYIESIRIRTTGSADKPITFKAAPGEKVIFDGNSRAINTAFSAVGKQHLRFDGLYFQGFGDGGWKSVLDLTQSQHIEVTRCFFNGYGAGGQGTMMRADRCTDVTVKNSVFSRGFTGLYFDGGSELQVQNCVFMNNLTIAIYSTGGLPGSLVMKNNIFADSIPSKVTVQHFEMGGFDRYVLDNNAFYLRVSDEERKALFFYGTGPGRMTVADYDEKSGSKNVVVTDPQFAITSGKEPVDSKGKKLEFLGDWIASQPGLDFPDLFTNHPELKARNIGLLPEAFTD